MFGADQDDQCPVCKRHTLVDNVCRTDTDVCCELCEKCGQIDVTGEAPCCERCAPVYLVATMAKHYYEGRSLRRAWEAHCYLDLAGCRDALILVPEAMDLDRDGLTDRETDCMAGWERYEGGAFLAVHTCIAPGDEELARRAQQPARAA